MSFDNDVRRLVRDLLRTGLDAERVLDLVIRELSEANSAQMLTSTEKATSIHPAHHRSPDDASAIMRMPDQTVVRWTVEMLHVPRPLPASAHPPPTKDSDPCPCCEGSGRSKGGGMRCVDCDATGIRNPELWEKTLAEVRADEAAARENGYCGRCGDMTTTGNPCESCRSRGYEPDYSYDEGDESQSYET